MRFYGLCMWLEMDCESIDQFFGSCYQVDIFSYHMFCCVILYDQKIGHACIDETLDQTRHHNEIANDQIFVNGHMCFAKTMLQIFSQDFVLELGHLFSCD